LLAGLTVALELELYAARYIAGDARFGLLPVHAQTDRALPDLLDLVDWTLVAPPVAMVIVASRESLIALFDRAKRAVGMAGNRLLDPTARISMRADAY
jgi:hypothetical protein